MPVRRHIAFASVLALLAAVMLAPGTQAAPGRAAYIIVLKDSISSPTAVAKRHQKNRGVEVEHVYENTIKGYSATLSKKELKALRADPNVKRVTRDCIATIAKKGGGKPGGGGTSGVGSWGLDRIDEHSLPMNGLYNPTGDGDGVRAFVLDTGVRITHNEFGGRASYGWDFVSDDGNANDCHGHGTHVAGTIGGATYGVAKKVDIVAVRVLDCSGSGYWSDIIAAIDWVADDSLTTGSGPGPKVANLSIGGPRNDAVNAAVNAAASKSNVTVVVAAGNEFGDACGYSPSSAAGAITVAATTSSDARAVYSNYGSCVDIFAPGDNIKSASNRRNSATTTKSGTSMAAPHVAGVVAILGAGASSDPTGSATSGKVSGANGSPNLLVFTEPVAGQNPE